MASTRAFTCTTACGKGLDHVLVPANEHPMQFPSLSQTPFMRINLFSQISFSLRDSLLRSLDLNEKTVNLIG